VLQLDQLAKSFGGRALFEGATLDVRPGDRIGLVGKNGAGKTTLLRILAGADHADSGHVHLQRGARVGYLRQEVSAVSERTVLEEAETALAPLRALEAKVRALEDEIARSGGEVPESLAARYDAAHRAFEAAGGFSADAELRSTLVGLGLGEDKWHQPLRKLSGGWLMRVELAKLLIAKPELLLLDEPTNHLDLPSIAWFEGVLSAYPGAVVVVSHDRVFLDRHANRIAELESSRLTAYRGNYSQYVSQKALYQADVDARRANLERAIAHKEKFVARFRYGTKASQAQSRLKSIDKLRDELGELPEAAANRKMRAHFASGVRPGQIVLRMERVAKAYGDNVVYRTLDFELARGERVALVGPNGAGKSTLLRMAAGALDPDRGDRELGHNVHAAFYAQHQVDALEPTRTALAELESSATIDDVPRLRGILGAFLFSGDDVEKKVGVLSGGEKARLALAKLLLARANFLVLDEPTNHLDIDARDVLTEALADYGGSLLFVSHDRRFIESLATRVVEITPGDGQANVREFLGGYEAYAEALRRDAEPPTPKRVAKAEPAAAKSATPSPKRDDAAKKARERGQRKLRERSETLEREIEALEAAVTRLDWLAADPDVARDGDRMREIAAERRTHKDKLDALYLDWERMTAELDR
jgi:ATP-binding cassette, subfamily F, member 3